MAHIDSLFVNSVLVLSVLHISGTLLASVWRRQQRVAAMASDRRRSLGQHDLS